MRDAVRAVFTALTHGLVRDYRRLPPPSRMVAIVVPLPLPPTLTADDELALRHLCHHLGVYDKFLVAPAGTSIARAGFETIHMPRKFFGSAAAHNPLMFWPQFYRRFADYEYILLHQLDALVFSDQLAQWCAAGWDYIGAPWLPCADTPWVREPRVGNGGLALMKVQSALEVLYRRHREDPATYWSDLMSRHARAARPLVAVCRRVQPLFPRSTVLSAVLAHWQMHQNPPLHGHNNDFLWSYEAVKYVPDFKVAPVEEGLRFAFEAAPRTCFEMNQRRLPFGCHAWAKFDAQFWRPYLLTDDGPRVAARSPDRRPLSDRPRAHAGWYPRYFKRPFDFVSALILLFAAAPVIAIVAVVVLVSMGRPVFFIERRAGRAGEVFRLRKFRTMTNALNAAGQLLPDEQRLTSIGRLLRRTSLDELPELLHVVSGRMSLVGPRPLPVRYIDRYSPEELRRLDVRPGVTGLAQVRGRNTLGWEQKFALDVWYVDHLTFTLDMRVLLGTLGVVVRGNGVSHPGHATMEEFVGR
jgi:lipopolysaccharide/colanic/teichoic acid biosynthesis glycosyltransferase